MKAFSFDQSTKVRAHSAHGAPALQHVLVEICAVRKGHPVGRADPHEPTAVGPETVDAVMTGRHEVPMFSTADEVAVILRTTRKAIYIMVERGLVPGVTKIGRRVLFRTDVLLDWLHQKRVPSPKE